MSSGQRHFRLTSGWSGLMRVQNVTIGEGGGESAASFQGGPAECLHEGDGMHPSQGEI